jgi:hypothetical protein
VAQLGSRVEPTRWDWSTPAEDSSLSSLVASNKSTSLSSPTPSLLSGLDLEQERGGPQSHAWDEALDGVCGKRILVKEDDAAGPLPCSTFAANSGSPPSLVLHQHQPSPSTPTTSSTTAGGGRGSSS